MIGKNTMQVAEVLPPKGDKKMAAITSATVTATYNLGKLTVKVEASGESAHGGIVLDPTKRSSSLYQAGNVFCINLDFEERPHAVDHDWTIQQTFDRSADYVVLLHKGSVLTAQSVDKVQRGASQAPASTPQQVASRRRRRAR